MAIPAQLKGMTPEQKQQVIAMMRELLRDPTVPVETRNNIRKVFIEMAGQTNFDAETRMLGRGTEASWKDAARNLAMWGTMGPGTASFMRYFHPDAAQGLAPYTSMDREFLQGVVGALKGLGHLLSPIPSRGDVTNPAGVIGSRILEPMARSLAQGPAAVKGITQTDPKLLLHALLGQVPEFAGEQTTQALTAAALPPLARGVTRGSGALMQELAGAGRETVALEWMKTGEEIANRAGKMEQAAADAKLKYEEAVRDWEAAKAEAERVHAEKGEVAATEHRLKVANYEAKVKASLDKWEASAEKVRKAHKEIEDWKELRDRVETQTKVDSLKLQKHLREVHGRIKATFDKRYDAIRERMGDMPMAGSGDTIAKAIRKAISDEGLAGAPDSLTVFNQTLKELGITREALESTDPAGISASVKDLPFNVAKAHREAVGIKLGSDLPSNVKGALRIVYNDGFTSAMQTGTDAVGMGDEFRALNRDYSEFVKDWQDTGTRTGSPLARGLESRFPYAVGQQALGNYGDEMANLLEKYKDFGGDRSLIDTMRRNVKTFKEQPKPGKRPEPPTPWQKPLGEPAALEPQPPLRGKPKPEFKRPQPPPPVKVRTPAEIRAQAMLEETARPSLSWAVRYTPLKSQRLRSWLANVPRRELLPMPGQEPAAFRVSPATDETMSQLWNKYQRERAAASPLQYSTLSEFLNAVAAKRPVTSTRPQMPPLGSARATGALFGAQEAADQK